MSKNEEQAKTVRVRAAVVVDGDGNWAACGWPGGLAREAAYIAKRSAQTPIEEAGDAE